MNKEEKPVHDLPPEKEVVVSPKGAKVDLTKEKPKEKKMEVTKEEFMAFVALNDKLVRIERMLEYLVIAQITDNQKILPEPDLRDILEEIAAQSRGKIKVPPKEKKDEVPADS